MDNFAGSWGGPMLWWLLLALIVIAAIVVWYLRSRTPAPKPQLESNSASESVSSLDSSHIGGPIVGTEQFRRFNPDVPTRKKSGARPK